jgi:transposase
MFSVLMSLRLWQVNPRTWLSAYLQACAENANRPPDLAGFLPWRMDAARLAALRSAPAFTQPPGVDTS